MKLAINTASAIEALVFAADRPEVFVINMSWFLTATPEFTEAIQIAHDAGKLLVAAAGNTGGPPVLYPASDPLVMAVSATDRFDDLYCNTSTGPAISVAAPGHAIVTTHINAAADQ